MVSLINTLMLTLFMLVCIMLLFLMVMFLGHMIDDIIFGGRISEKMKVKIQHIFE